MGTAGHDVHFLTQRVQPESVDTPAGTTLHRLHGHTRAKLRAFVGGLELDSLLLNPERSRRYRGLHANVLRSGYGTDHYSEKLRSFREPAALAIRRALRVTPWALAERRWERQFYEAPAPSPDVIAQSEYMRGRITERYRVPADHVHVIHNGVDLSEFNEARRRGARAEARARWSIPDDVTCLLLLGHNFRLKGFGPLLRAVATLPRTAPVHVLVVGRGTGRAQRTAARRLVATLGMEDHVIFAGTVATSFSALAAADVLTHLSWHDSFGFVVLEAMACGLPVVTTPFVGAAELIEDGVSGMIVRPDDPEEVVAALGSLTDGELRYRLGAAAAAAAERHDEETNFSAVAGVLRIAAGRLGRPIDRSS